jgi:hypothetical protein
MQEKEAETLNNRPMSDIVYCWECDLPAGPVYSTNMTFPPINGQ